MKRTGRTSFVVIIGLLCLIIILPVLFMTGQTPERAAQEFMVALAEGDVPKLAELSTFGGYDEAKRRELWQKAVERSEHYRFAWRITDTREIQEGRTAVVQIQLRRNLQLKMGESENGFEIPMRKVEGKWKVDVHTMDRDIYPALPRG